MAIKPSDKDTLDGIADNVFSAIDSSVNEARELKRKKVAENVQLVVDALKKIEADIRDRYDSIGNKLEQRIISTQAGLNGTNGRDGRDGKDGKNGRDGAPGPRGADGAPGKDGVDGTDGVSVTDARIDFDGSLIIGLSSGREINVGEVIAPTLAEQIKVITNGGGTSQSVLDTLTSLQTQINALIPSQTGNSGKFLTTDGTSTSWAAIVPRVSSSASASSLTPDAASYDVYAYTALAANLTINAPTGSPVDGQKLTFRFLDNGTGRSLTWNATYTAIGVTIPTSTNASKTVYIGCIYNSNNTRWDVVAVSTQA